AYEKAIELQPAMAEAHTNLGNAYRALLRHDDAVAAYEKALAIQPGNAEVICNIGNIFKDQGRFDDAIARYQSAIEIQPELAIAHSNLAHVLERTHQNDAARGPAERAIQIDPGHVGAHRLLARLDRAEGHLDKAEQRLAAIVDQPWLTEPMAHASIEYGAVLDRLGRADEAFAAVQRGQQGIVPPNSPTVAQMAAFEAMLERCRTQPSDETIAGWTGPTGHEPSDRLIFLLGFPRSGTTLSEQILGSHPSLLTTDERPLLRAVIERIPEITGREDYPASIEGIDDAGAASLRETYWAEAESLIGPEALTRRLIDKQPYNTTHMPLIRRLFPAAHLLIALRDPRDACLSLFFQDVRPNQGMLHYPDLGAVVSVYNRMMSCYLRYRDIPGWNLKEFRYEDLVADKDGVTRALLEFLGEPWNDAVLDHTETARTKHLSTINYQDVAQPVFDRSVQKWRAYEPHFAPHQATLARFVETFGYQA
ncbi:MAG: sulfotransferase, partial [Phycisphaerales bacterium]|nr:sulfotransferase [Phycisphaerales bacterium]